MSGYLGFTPDTEDYYFVSYNNENQEMLQTILVPLHELGVKLWYDKGIKGGEDWEERIARMICGSRGVLMFITDELLQKEGKSWVLTEYHIAEDNGIGIYPIYMETIAPSDVEFKFKSFYSDIRYNRQGAKRKPGMSDSQFARMIAVNVLGCIPEGQSADYLEEEMPISEKGSAGRSSKPITGKKQAKEQAGDAEFVEACKKYTAMYGDEGKAKQILPEVRTFVEKAQTLDVSESARVKGLILLVFFFTTAGEAQYACDLAESLQAPAERLFEKNDYYVRQLLHHHMYAAAINRDKNLVLELSKRYPAAEYEAGGDALRLIWAEESVANDMFECGFTDEACEHSATALRLSEKNFGELDKTTLKALKDYGFYLCKAGRGSESIKNTRLYFERVSRVNSTEADMADGDNEEERRKALRDAEDNIMQAKKVLYSRIYWSVQACVADKRISDEAVQTILLGAGVLAEVFTEGGKEAEEFRKLVSGTCYAFDQKISLVLERFRKAAQAKKDGGMTEAGRMTVYQYAEQENEKTEELLKQYARKAADAQRLLDCIRNGISEYERLNKKLIKTRTDNEKIRQMSDSLRRDYDTAEKLLEELIEQYNELLEQELNDKDMISQRLRAAERLLRELKTYRFRL